MTALAAALRTLHAAGRIASPWLSGMADTTGRRFVEWADCGESRWLWVADDGCETLSTTGSPDTTDPATVGCALALLREASGDLAACVEHTGRPGLAWRVSYVEHADGIAVGVVGINSPTEGEAIAAALIAIAGAP